MTKLSRTMETTLFNLRDAGGIVGFTSGANKAQEVCSRGTPWFERRTMEALVRRGYVERLDSDRYAITAEGNELAKRIGSWMGR